MTPDLMGHLSSGFFRFASGGLRSSSLSITSLKRLFVWFDESNRDFLDALLLRSGGLSGAICGDAVEGFIHAFFGLFGHPSDCEFQIGHVSYLVAYANCSLFLEDPI